MIEITGPVLPAFDGLRRLTIYAGDMVYDILEGTSTALQKYLDGHHKCVALYAKAGQPFFHENGVEQKIDRIVLSEIPEQRGQA